MKLISNPNLTDAKIFHWACTRGIPELESLSETELDKLLFAAQILSVNAHQSLRNEEWGQQIEEAKQTIVDLTTRHPNSEKISLSRKSNNMRIVLNALVFIEWCHETGFLEASDQEQEKLIQESPLSDFPYSSKGQ